MATAKEWNKATRVKNGGVHIYIPKEAIEKALVSCGMDASETALSAKAIWLKSDHRKSARIIITLRQDEIP